MEILGPSISNILKLIHDNRFSFSTTIRTIYHMLKCIESFHIFGLIHRDIKPGNILTREGHEHPLCLVDFGLSHVYIDPNSGKILPPRKRLGFRGTKVYASIYAHQNEDLGRRDDLLSWFYVSMELLVGSLPWRGKTDKYEILQMKLNYNVQEAIGNKVPELVTIYNLLSRLSFADTPNYAQIYQLLDTAMKRNHISMDDPYDWSDILHSQRQKTAHALENLTIKYKLTSVKADKALNEITLHTPLLPHISAAAPFRQADDDSACCC
ncbi:Casein kinase I, putative [Trichomonas vaginalis G3]|uniref:non-specific serine/threonine protein kinase n=2 Tax=Trichomonas vaginalis (strain ATCC PRA-98 / G3) TaxID=412133 RepID=A2DRQ1_TRIV3|nr:Casein kinase I, putative [Trichomonas vaginalis G3]|eukprot:XP_001329071.1 Casein kinase I [Trichomonas vaginalis G3]